MISEELKDELRLLFEHFDIGEDAEGEWPSTYVYHSGVPTAGPISDELYDILIRIYEIYIGEKDE